MKEHLCEYQDSLLVTGAESYVLSRCVNSQCPMKYSPINKAICMECSFRVPPTQAAQDDRQSRLPAVPNLDLVKKRDDGEVLELMTKYCYRCKFYNRQLHICTACDCLAFESINDKAVDATFHCPLKVW